MGGFPWAGSEGSPWSLTSGTSPEAATTARAGGQRSTVKIGYTKEAYNYRLSNNFPQHNKILDIYHYTTSKILKEGF